MTTNFPQGRDNLRRPTAEDNTSDPDMFLDEVLDDISDAIEALEDYVGFQPQNTQTGTSYEFVLADAGKLVIFNNASPIAASIPASVFLTSQRIDCLVIGTGMVTISPGTGTPSVNGTPSLISRAQYSMFSIFALSPTSFVVAGDLA